MKKQYFTEAYLHFFMDLAANNHKDWFDQNRSRYQTEVKARMEVFVGDLIASLKKDADLGDLKPSDCIFRINKDIRLFVMDSVQIFENQTEEDEKYPDEPGYKGVFINAKIVEL
jgi:uncharacterized protein (DUF2461 family)